MCGTTKKNNANAQPTLPGDEAANLRQLSKDRSQSRDGARGRRAPGAPAYRRCCKKTKQNKQQQKKSLARIMLKNLFACRRQSICDQCLVLADTSAHVFVLFFLGSLQSSMESPNLEFEYGDTDALTAELSGKAWQRRGETVHGASLPGASKVLGKAPPLSPRTTFSWPGREFRRLFSHLALVVNLPSELYSYTEEPEFALNRDYFEEDFRSHGTVCVCLCSQSLQ